MEDDKSYVGAKAPTREPSKDRAVSMGPAQGILLHRSSGQGHRRSLRYLDSSVLVAGRERGGDWKAFPAVACALVLKQILSKSFCIFIQMLHSNALSGSSAGLAALCPVVCRTETLGAVWHLPSAPSPSVGLTAGARGAGCVSDVGLAAGAQFQRALPTAAPWWRQELSSFLSSARKTVSCQEGCSEISWRYKWKSKGRCRKRWERKSKASQIVSLEEG